MTPQPASPAAIPPIPGRRPVSCPPSHLHSPSLTRPPLPHEENDEAALPTLKGTPIRTPRIYNITPDVMTPLGSPVRKASRFTELDPQDAWLPITESRNGNKYYAAFHTLCSGIGVPALLLPVAFTFLGWGTIILTVAFMWQLYTLRLLVELHESWETGIRYSRYLQLCYAAFGERNGKLLALFPIMCLSGGTCGALISIGGSMAKTFFHMVCGDTCSAKPLTTVEWYMVFTSATVVLSQLPKLNSLAGVSLIGAITAVGYCTFIWVVPPAEGRLPGVSYKPIHTGFGTDPIDRIVGVVNALGIIAFAFRGHNLILEIQATMPSNEKHPSRVPMWKGVKAASTLIAACLFPLAICGYWTYGHLIPANGGMLTALYKYHSRDASRLALGLTSLLVIINALASFQIYGMPMFDDMELQFTSRMKKPCPWWLRSIMRAVFGYGCFFMAVAIPFSESVACLVGGMALPVTLAYPCFMWLKIKKPKRNSGMWWLNWLLGVLGMGLSGILVVAGAYVVINTRAKVSFFKPHS